MKPGIHVSKSGRVVSIAGETPPRGSLVRAGRLGLAVQTPGARLPRLGVHRLYWDAGANGSTSSPGRQTGSCS